MVKDEVEWVASVATYNKSKEVNYGSEPSGSQLFKNRSKITKVRLDVYFDRTCHVCLPLLTISQFFSF